MPEDWIDHALTAVDWRGLGADPTAVTAALRQLSWVTTEAAGDTAYAEVLDAVGHNHSGELFDAAGPAAAILVDVARRDNGWARRTAIEVLVDCLYWARPEQHAAAVIRAAVTNYRDELRALAAGPGATARSATELLQALDA
ncbi:hypothetical protein [Asanoa iriomotensis]|uniref:HEAT repeat domain-containing protein n=1 Tax=Asanoa iriomotensis TaxID=234613 RepID=A0ABQ4CDD2_9ACTN|nr:hypothetical protein [Asanoa iriomotensis]GIF60788.1 hypothetical protein Air01nite_68830 [Asanoa iriomotensis]